MPYLVGLIILALQAIVRQLTGYCSSLDYARAIDDYLEGYGIRKRSTSREWNVVREVSISFAPA